MSLLPLLYRDWWDDIDRPSRLLDQNFGLGLRQDDLLNAWGNFRRPAVTRTGYLRPWREMNRQNSGSSTIQVANDSFQVTLDVQQFAPSEITVKVVGQTVIVEGRHEEKPDEHGFISRHFVRKYQLPQDIQSELVSSSLSSDGVLIISAPKKNLQAVTGERVVPIIATGTPAQSPTTAPSQQQSISQGEP